MRYYIRQQNPGDVQGPFSAEELVGALEARRISGDCVASSDLGDSIDRLRAGRDCDWFPISEIPELSRHLPAREFLPPHPARVTILILGLWSLGAACSIYNVATGSTWFGFLSTIFVLRATLERFQRYRDDRRFHGPVA